EIGSESVMHLSGRQEGNANGGPTLRGMGGIAVSRGPRHCSPGRLRGQRQYAHQRNSNTYSELHGFSSVVVGCGFGWNSDCDWGWGSFVAIFRDLPLRTYIR